MNSRPDASGGGVVARWLADLGTLCASNMSVADAQQKMRLYAKHLPHEFSPDCFNERSLRHVASRCRFFPTFGELTDALREWVREHRMLDGGIFHPEPPPPERRIAAPPPPPRDARPPEEREEDGWVARVKRFEEARDYAGLVRIRDVLTRAPGTHGPRDPGAAPRPRAVAAVFAAIGRLEEPEKVA